jgi:allophanate hydrolase
MNGAQETGHLAPDRRRRQRTVQVVVVGAHLSGFPLNSQLIERGARRLALTRTAPRYRLYRIPASQPAKPGLVRVARGEGGCATEVEVWEMPTEG